MKFKSKNFLSIFSISLLSVFLVPPAHAYAGPGVAIGAIIVGITVLLAFFSSLLIRIFNLIKFVFNFLKRKINQNTKHYKKEKSTKRQNIDS